MSSYEENISRIVDYLEDKMTLQEEEIFMQDLGNDESLRQQYEDELLIRGLLETQPVEYNAENHLALQSADEHIAIVETTLEKKSKQSARPKVVKMFNGYRIAAAASIIIILVSLLFLFIKRNNNNEVVRTSIPPVLKDSVEQRDSVMAKNQQHEHVDEIKKHEDSGHHYKSPMPEDENKKNLAMDSNHTHSSQIAQNPSYDRALAESLYKESYAPYARNENDPTEVKPFYNSYNSGDYANVLSATDADIQLMGSSKRDDLLKQYMLLYKGLSYLAENKPKEAIQYLDSVLQLSSHKSNQYYQAQWYQALAYLKNNDIHRTEEIAKEITPSQSIYKIKAEELLAKLKGN